MPPKGNSTRYTGEPREKETAGDKIAQAIISTGEYLNEKISNYRELAHEYQKTVDSKGSFYEQSSEVSLENAETWSLEDNGRRALGSDD